MKVFLKSAREQIKSLQQAIIDGNNERVKKEAHTIKGGAANLTAYKLSKIAYELENLGKSGSLQGAADVMDRLESEFSRLEIYFEGR